MKYQSDLRKSKNNNSFCSISCATTYNNKTRSIIKFPKNRICKKCGKIFYKSKKQYCENCKIDQKFEEQTVYNVVNKWIKSKNPSSANKFSSIRNHARKAYINTNSKCVRCGYNKHVNICHIKPIKDFDPNTKIKNSK